MESALIVDDETAIRDALVLALQDEGFSCQQAENGVEALRLMRECPGRLTVLLDLLMPQMDGREVLEIVADDPQLAGRHAIILLTASNRTLPLALERLMDRLDVSMIGKPFEMDALVEVVRAACASLNDARPASTLAKPRTM